MINTADSKKPTAYSSVGKIVHPIDKNRKGMNRKTSDAVPSQAHPASQGNHVGGILTISIPVGDGTTITVRIDLTTG